MGKELTTKTSTDLAFLFSVNDEEALAIMNADAENYVDDTNTEDIAIPRLVCLQSMSKQVKKSEAEYIKGAEEGDLFQTLSKKIYAGDEGVYFVPVKRRVIYLHWKDINAGGGLIENFGEDPTEYMKVMPNEKGKRRTSGITEIVKTHETFGYLIDLKTKTFEQVLMVLASTQEKKQRRFNALIRSLTNKQGKMLPEYAGVYKITTAPESNDQGSWFTYEFTSAGLTLGIPEIGQAIYNSAKSFAEMIKKDEVAVKYEQDGSEDIDEPTETDLM